MKTDELLYELMEDIDATEAAMITNNLKVSQKTLKRQECLTMDKIRAEMKKETRIPFGKKRLAILVATAVMMFGMVAVARENDWDVEMAEMLGLSGVMEALDGGYVLIEKSDKQADITVTAVQSIGDQNSQWIQFDTDIPWTVGEDGYYMFDECEFRFTKKGGGIIEGGTEFYSYNNNGKVSFMLYAIGIEKINRANVSIELGMLYEYETLESEGRLLSDNFWNLTWTNYYASNTITKHPLSVVDDLWIQKIEISPISIYVEAIAIPSEESRNIVVEQIKLEDGTIISCRNMVGGNANNMFLDNYVVYEDWDSVDLEELESITINGKEIKIR